MSRHGENGGTEAGRPRAALAMLSQILDRLGGRRPAFFLDFDGTLAPIAPHPEQARMETATRTVIARLVGRHPVCVLSGRRLADLRDRVRVPGVRFAAEHGFVLDTSEGPRLAPPVTRRHLAAVAAAGAHLKRRVVESPGAWMEEKWTSRAVHVRAAQPAVKRALQAVAQHVTDADPLLRLVPGKEVLEVQPRVDWDKGAALRGILTELDAGGDPLVPVVLGDDVTDEDAFRAAGNEAVTVRVGGASEATAARFRVEDTHEVRRLLAAFLE